MSAKNRDPKQHWRCKTIGFRLSPEENERLDMQVQTSGLFKQDFITRRVLNEEIVVRPNIRIQTNIIRYLTDLTAELHRLEQVPADSYILENIRYLLNMIAQLSK